MSDAIAIAVALVTVVGALFAAVWYGHDSGKKAAEKEVREKVDDEVAKAEAARAAVRPSDADSMRDDPNNRDNGVSGV